MHGEMSLVLLDKSSTISEAVGRLVGVMLQHDLSKVSLEKKKFECENLRAFGTTEVKLSKTMVPNF
jgi:hypothetical protein